MMVKLGWQEGEGLGSEGQGITAPVNKLVHLLIILSQTSLSMKSLEECLIHSHDIDSELDNCI